MGTRISNVTDPLGIDKFIPVECIVFNMLLFHSFRICMFRIGNIFHDIYTTLGTSLERENENRGVCRVPFVYLDICLLYLSRDWREL